MHEHSFSTSADGKGVIVSYPGVCSLRDYMLARSNQLKALTTFMATASEGLTDLDHDVRTDLVWLVQTLAHEIADAISVIAESSNRN